MQSREVGDTPQPECLAQFAVLAKTHFRLAKGAVLAAHQVENGQQLRLVELLLAEMASLAREHRPRNLRGDATEWQESDFGHRTSCLNSKQQFHLIGSIEFSLW